MGNVDFSIERLEVVGTFEGRRQDDKGDLRKKQTKRGQEKTETSREPRRRMR